MNELLLSQKGYEDFGPEEDERVTDGQGSGGWGLPKWRELGEKGALRVEWIEIEKYSVPGQLSSWVGQRIKPNEPNEPVTPLLSPSLTSILVQLRSSCLL